MPRAPFSYTAQWDRGLGFAMRFTTTVMNETTTKILPYLERLLDGEEVEWKTLGEVGTFVRGTSFQKKHFVEKGVGCIHYGEIYTRYGLFAKKTISYLNEEIANKARKASYGDLIIATTSENDDDVCKSVAWLGSESIVVSNDACYYHHTLNPKYVAYFFRTDEFQRQKRTYITGTKVKRVNANDLAKITLPIPPLRVQARIVEILDKFTQLEAELEAELEARRKQYAYYRDQLLNFSQCPPLNVNIEWKTLGEVMEIVTDFTAAGSFASNAQNVRYLQEPNYALLVRTTDIKQGFKSTEKFIYVDQHAFEYLWRVNLDKECIILPNVGKNCGEVYHSSPTILPYKNCVLGPNAILVRSEKASNKFLYYLFQAEYFQKELAKITSNAGQGKFNKTNLKQIKLPIPPLFKQRRIVDILDRFDTLTNSINEGLPKEIALRRKQYEYYRDALLSFPRPEVSA